MQSIWSELWVASKRVSSSWATSKGWRQKVCRRVAQPGRAVRYAGGGSKVESVLADEKCSAKRRAFLSEGASRTSGFVERFDVMVQDEFFLRDVPAEVSRPQLRGSFGSGIFIR